MATQHPHPQQQAYPPAWAAPNRPWDAAAVTGFVLSLIGLGIIGLPLSFYGAIQAGRKGRRGTGLGIAGILIGFLTAWAGVAFIGAIITSA